MTTVVNKQNPSALVNSASKLNTVGKNMITKEDCLPCILRTQKPKPHVKGKNLPKPSTHTEN